MKKNIEQGLKKGMLIIFISNIINLVFKIFINFVQPKFLSVNTYAMIQTYTLYISYAAILHFGYIDGMYLSYGGKELDKVDQKKLNDNVSTLRSMQLIVTFFCLGITFFVKNQMILFMSLSIIPVNLSAYFRMLFQAIGHFDKYGKIMNIHSALLFIFSFFLLMVFKTDNYIFYIWSNIFSYTIIWLVLEINYKQIIGFKKNKLLSFNLKELKNNILEGFPLTIGNLASTFLFSLDRWFVKLKLDTNSFAFYSFSVSIVTFLNIAITPITITLYNYFCSHTKKEEINFIKNIVIIFSTFVVSSVFIAKIIIQIFIPDYSSSINVIFILFATKIFDILIQGIFVNQYKANKKQNLYLRHLTFCLFISLIINSICYFLKNSMEIYSIGTFVTMILWFFICSNDLKTINIKIIDFTLMFLPAIALILLGCFANPFIGFFVYMIFILILDYLVYKKELIYLINSMITILNRKRRI